MTISPSEIRKSVGYEALKAYAISAPEPDTVGFMIGTDEYEEMVEVECLSSGLKSVYRWEGPGLRIELELETEEFNSWSEALRRKTGELLAELASCEASLRQPGEAWDAVLLADPLRPGGRDEPGEPKEEE